MIEGNPSSVDENSKHFVLTHTMLRIKDPAPSLDFYRNALDMQLVKTISYANAKFSVYFLTMAENSSPPGLTDDQLTAWMFSQRGLIELTHNWGTENDPSLRIHNGNDAPQGYGHMCISVPDIRAACERFEKMGVKFHKRIGEGGMKDMAIICDPDGYRYEIVQPDLLTAIMRGSA